MISKNQNIKIIAHRGALSVAPENTLTSFRRAKELGAQTIELDVHLSADDELIVHHDYYLGHPDNGTGLIKKLTRNQIKQVDAGTWFSDQFSQEKIPLLEEVFAEFSQTIDYEIELKGTTIQFLKKILLLVNKHQLRKHIEFTSPHLALVCRLKQLDKTARCGILFTQYPTWMSSQLGESIIVDTMGLVPAEVAHLPISILTKSLVKTLHDHNVSVHLADCNSIETINKAVTYHCDQFSTNDIALAKKVVESS